MKYSIYTTEQISPATIVTKTLEGIFSTTENPQQVAIPAGKAVVYAPPEYSRFSADAACRKLLLSDPNGTATTDEIMAVFPKILDDKHNALWQAAHDFESRYISGVGLSILSLGVAQNKPKALAVAQWSQELWAEYYRRKALIYIESNPQLDFDSRPPMPFSVPELATEVGLS